jgi:hypothetical protein
VTLQIRLARRLEEAWLAGGPPGESADIGTSKDPPGCPGAPLIAQPCHYLYTSRSLGCQEEKAK